LFGTPPRNWEGVYAGVRVYRQDAICDMKNAKGELKSIYKRRTKI
jgi:hypothetical protein